MENINPVRGSDFSTTPNEPPADDSVPTHCEVLLENLMNNDPGLVGLHLSGPQFTDAMVQDLAAVLVLNNQLTSLKLADNVISPATTEALFYMLIANVTLKELCLLNNQLDIIGTYNICTGAAANLSLQSLELSNNRLGLAGATQIGVLLQRENVRLRELSLNECQLDFPATRFLAKGLAVNTSLVKLELRANSIDDNGAEELADVLHYNSTLTALDLSDNPIGDRGRSVLLGAVQKNRHLCYLALSETPAPNASQRRTMAAMAAALESNQLLAQAGAVEDEASGDETRTRQFYEDACQQFARGNFERARNLFNAATMNGEEQAMRSLGGWKYASFGTMATQSQRVIDSAKVRLDGGMALVAQGDLMQAQEAFVTALVLCPDLGSAWEGLGVVHLGIPPSARKLPAAPLVPAITRHCACNLV
ncbi:hypothetical protein [Chitinimonas arctica]|nr:hypothetical protein [Chitinimonas arctica]